MLAPQDCACGHRGQRAVADPPFPAKGFLPNGKVSDVVEKAKGLRAVTQEQLAEAAGISSRTVKKMEAKGVGSSPARQVAKVARCLGCTVEDLIGEEDGGKK